jgi:hypothetical protein
MNPQERIPALGSPPAAGQILEGVAFGGATPAQWGLAP